MNVVFFVTPKPDVSLDAVLQNQTVHFRSAVFEENVEVLS